MALTPEKQVEAFIGVWGVKTSQIGSVDQLLDIAAQVFEVERADARQMARAIEALGRKGRKELAARNLGLATAGMASSPPSSKAAIERPTLHMLDRMMEAASPELIDGEPFGVDGELDIDPATLLRKVVVAVINAGHADDLYDFPEVLAYFGARNPETRN